MIKTFDKINLGYVLAYFTDQVLVGIYKDNNYIFANNYDADKLIKLHIFDGHKELRYNPEYKDEVIIDEKDDNTYFDEAMFILGDNTTAVNTNHFYRYTQNGRVIDIPEELVKDPSKSMKLVIRNVFGIDKNTHQVTIDHYRIIGFTQEEGENNG